MSVVAWIIVGLIAGVLARLIVPGTESGGWIITIVLGIVGALVGGFVWSLVGEAEVTGINFTSIAIATLGAIIVLALYRLIVARR